ncbi:MAG TPA: L,D-transpeptidase family protein [Beijerinckiaceae bacterium]|nr:L,D-transpeptidase family protein [Beijerinckiaceae bacterium]
MKGYCTTIVVYRLEPRGPRALLVAGPLAMPCRIGRNGAACAKREGDGASPLGTFALLGGWWRNDRRRRPQTGLCLTAIRKDDGWCDAPGHRAYNRPVRLPFAASHESMARNDHQYDVVLDISWNRHPRRQGWGSAIFLHLMSETGGGTAGCVAVPAGRIDRLLVRIGPQTRIRIR